MEIGDILKNQSVPDLRSVSPLSLAFLGDAVYEVYIRSRVLSQGNRPAGQLHRMAVAYVKASAQAQAFYAIGEKLTEEETAVFKRGRNTNIHTVPKHAQMQDYRVATGFEALIGYLYLTEQTQRLCELLEHAYNALSQQNI